MIQKRSHDAYAALRLPEFRNLVVASFLLTCAQHVQEVVIGYELYRITRDPLALGLVGLVEAIPFMSLSLFGGHVADRISKRRLVLYSVAGILVSSALLQTAARYSHEMSSEGFMVLVYSAVFVIGVCRAFYSPAATSFRAFLVPMSLYENASTWSSSAWQTGAIIGPAAAGFLYAWTGFANTLLIVAVLVTAAWFLVRTIGDRPSPVPARAVSVWQSISDGIRFVFQTKIILYSISLDLFSVLFGGVVAILPVYAEDILKVGAQGLGILRAAPSLGAVVMLMILTRISPMGHAWRNLLFAVVGFGMATLVFAVSPWMVLSVAALFFAGAFDSISVVIRATILQVMTPDEMRGRVQAVNGIFLASSNELGAFESGVAARLMGAIPSAVFGGSMTLVIVVWVYFRTKDLLQTKILRSP